MRLVLCPFSADTKASWLARSFNSRYVSCEFFKDDSDGIRGKLGLQLEQFMNAGLR